MATLTEVTSKRSTLSDLVDSIKRVPHSLVVVLYKDDCPHCIRKVPQLIEVTNLQFLEFNSEKLQTPRTGKDEIAEEKLRQSLHAVLSVPKVVVIKASQDNDPTQHTQQMKWKNDLVELATYHVTDQMQWKRSDVTKVQLLVNTVLELN